MKKYITIILLIVLTFAAKAQDTLTLTLDECRNEALSNSEAIKIAGATIEKAAGEKTAAMSNWFPNISATAVGVYSQQDFEYEIELPSALPIPIQIPPLELSLYGGASASVSAQQPIYAGGRIAAGTRMAKIGTQMAEANMQMTKSQITYNVDNAYYTYLSVKEKVVMAKMYLDLLKELVAVVENSYNAGIKNQNDLLKVKVKHNEANIQLQKAKNGLELSRMALCQAIGLDLSTVIFINNEIKTETYDSINFAATSAYDRVEYKLLEQQVFMAEQQVKLTRGDYLPSVGVGVAYGYFNIGLNDKDNYQSHGLSALATVRIPITTFGEGIGKIKSAKATQQIAQMELEQKANLLQLEIEQAKQNVTEAYNRIEMTIEALSQAHENVRISKDSYDLGVEPVVNLLEAQTVWQQAYSSYIDAITEYKIAECNFLRVTNQLE